MPAKRKTRSTATDASDADIRGGDRESAVKRPKPRPATRTEAADKTGHEFKNFKAACAHYGFPGSHQVGSYGPKGTGIVRTYTNGTPFKDKFPGVDGRVFLYRLKDEAVRAQFKVNAVKDKPVRVFQKTKTGTIDRGLHRVCGFEPAGSGDHVEEFGSEFVRFERLER